MSKKTSSRWLPQGRQAAYPPAAAEQSDSRRDEAAAARTLLAQRELRATACLADILTALGRHGCTFQVIVQETMTPGAPGSARVTQVNVVPLDTPGPNPTAAASSGPSANGAPPPA